MALSLYRRQIPWILAAALTIAALFAATASADGGQATSAQENAGHTGFASGGSLDAPPLTEAWSVNLGSTLTYPLIADGLVYVIETDSQHTGPTLDALSATSGATVWQRPVTSGTTIAYDTGRVFIAQSGGFVTAADASTGDTDWAQTFSDESNPSATASDGTLYLTRSLRPPRRRSPMNPRCFSMGRRWRLSTFAPEFSRGRSRPAASRARH